MEAGPKAEAVSRYGSVVLELAVAAKAAVEAALVVVAEAAVRVS